MTFSARLGGAVRALERMPVRTFRLGLLGLLVATHAIYMARGLSTPWDFVGSRSYAQIARHIVTHGVYAQFDGQAFTAYRPPLYPLFVAAHQWAFPGSWSVALVVSQAALSVATGWLLVLLTERMFRDRLVVLLAVGLYATNLLHIEEVLSQRETVLFTFLVLTFFVLLMRRGASPAILLGLGLLAGLAHLTRPTGLVLLGALPWPLAELARRRGLRVASLGAALAASGFLAVAAPWQVLIRQELGVAMMTSSITGGEALFKGNNPDLLTMYPYVWIDLYEPWLQRAMREGKALPGDEVARDRVLRAAALRFIVEHPGHFLVGLGWKLVGHFLPRPTPLGKAEVVDVGGRVMLRGYRRVETLITRVMTGHTTLLLFGAALFVGWRRARGSAQCPIGAAIAFCLLLIGVHVLTVPYSRYRVPLDALFAAAAAAAYGTLVREWSSQGSGESGE